ncbi:MAG: hypothetical protein DRO00_05295, partial [Thermoproteota archaeon]
MTILLIFALLIGWIVESASASFSEKSEQTYGIDIKKPVLIVYRDKFSMPANLMALSIRYQAVMPEDLGELNPFDFSAIIFDYGVGHEDVRDWILSNNWRLLKWLESGGAILDFTSGENTVLFDLRTSLPEDFEAKIVADHPILYTPNDLTKTNPVAQVVFTGGSDLRDFEAVIAAGGKPTVLVREIGKGRVVICGLYGIGPWFKGGFVENALYWATKGQLWASMVYAMREVTEHFVVLYPP